MFPRHRTFRPYAVIADVHLVKRFRKVDQDDIDLFLVVQGVRQITDGDDKLTFAGSSLPKSMLIVYEDVVRVKVLYDIAVDDMLHEFRTYGGQ